MQNRPSQNPRDDAIRAALRDGAILAGIVVGEYHATYQGPERAEYLRVLAANITDLGGSLEQGPAGITAVFAGRRIMVWFGAGGGRR
jgi:hypothetical protein